jgi:hypothetical protein
MFDRSETNRERNDAKGVSAMTPKDETPPKVEVIKKKTQSEEEPAGVHKHQKRRKHGYRGYPNKPDVGGAIHTGTGFAGVGSTGASASGSGVITEKTRESIEELEEEEEK